VAGFVSKWFLGLGALESGQVWALGVLVASSLLNAGYFLPPVIAAWFAPKAGPWNEPQWSRLPETRWTLLVPAMTTATLALIAGLLAASDYSPLFLAREVTLRIYGAP
jgi:NADH:ubiquinone oxidoreductase subunit 2 (subunit N)